MALERTCSSVSCRPLYCMTTVVKAVPYRLSRTTVQKFITKKETTKSNVGTHLPFPVPAVDLSGRGKRR